MRFGLISIPRSECPRIKGRFGFYPEPLDGEAGADGRTAMAKLKLSNCFANFFRRKWMTEKHFCGYIVERLHQA